jgi:hypothetical protein
MPILPSVRPLPARRLFRQLLIAIVFNGNLLQSFDFISTSELEIRALIS